MKRRSSKQTWTSGCTLPGIAGGTWTWPTTCTHADDGQRTKTLTDYMHASCFEGTGALAASWCSQPACVAEERPSA